MIELVLDRDWQLIENVLISLCENCLVPIICPLVKEVLLDVLLEGQIYLDITVEILNKSKEFGELVTIIEVFI